MFPGKLEYRLGSYLIGAVFEMVQRQKEQEKFFRREFRVFLVNENVWARINII
jgi:hypothetical protein